MDVTIPHPHRRRFKLINKAFRRNYEFIHDDDDNDNTPGATHKGKTPLFVIDTSVFTRGKPDITLHRGPDDSISSPAVACCYIPSVTRTFRIGLGDAVRAQELVHWEEMRQMTLSMSKFAWSMDLPDGRRQALMWKRTSHYAVDGKKINALSSRNWKLVKISDGPDYATAAAATATANAKHIQVDTSSDEHGPKTDEILAVFTSATGITTVCGTLQVNVDWGSAFDYLVLVTLVAMYEKLKRSRHNSGGGGGGGGG